MTSKQLALFVALTAVAVAVFIFGVATDRDRQSTSPHFLSRNVLFYVLVLLLFWVLLVVARSCYPGAEGELWTPWRS